MKAIVINKADHSLSYTDVENPVLKDGEVAFDGLPWKLFASDEIVRNCSLRLPSGVKLANELRAVGFNIDETSITIEKVVDDVCKNLEKKETENA